RCCRTRTSPSKACTAAWSGPTADGGAGRRGVFRHRGAARGDGRVPPTRLVSVPSAAVAACATRPPQTSQHTTDTEDTPDGREQEARPCRRPEPDRQAVRQGFGDAHGRPRDRGG